MTTDTLTHTPDSATEVTKETITKAVERYQQALYARTEAREALFKAEDHASQVASAIRIFLEKNGLDADMLQLILFH